MFLHKNLFYFVWVILEVAGGLKTWIQNTGLNNLLNWDSRRMPEDCDRLFFPVSSDIATYWNIKDLVISGLSLPKTGEIIFPDNVNLRFRDEAKCSEGKDVKYTRGGVKGWLDGDNWKPEDETQWVPHSERVPCAGEKIVFPSDNTISVQLPSILLPMTSIKFGTNNFESDEWHRFLNTELGFELFKGPDDARFYQWRTDVGCFDKKKCTCSRSAYTIRDGVYKEVNPRIFDEAICLYAMPKCQSINCYSPVVPEGHCCGICGAVLKLEDNSDDGYDLNDIKSRVQALVFKNGFDKDVKTYVGRTKDGNIQIVVVAEDSSNTISSHTLANAIVNNFTDHKFQSKLTSHLSGLTFSTYLFNRISGIVFGTLFSVLGLFAALFYVYVIQPNKNFSGSRPFVFARFDNTGNEDGCEENLEVGIQPEDMDESPIQAFDNPIYSEAIDIKSTDLKAFQKAEEKESESKVKEKTGGTQEYHNLVYDDLQKTEKLNNFDDDDNKEDDVKEDDGSFMEIKL